MAHENAKAAYPDGDGGLRNNEQLRSALDRSDTPATATTQAPRLPLLIAEWRKNSRESVRVAIEEFKGTPCISVRVFFEAAPGDIRPGRSGLSMSAKHLPQLAAALGAALAKARAMGIVDAEGGVE